MHRILVDELLLRGQARAGRHAEAAIQETHRGRADGGRTRGGRGRH